MTTQVLLESIMLICFGVSWPVAIVKTVKTKNPAGKSMFFLVLIIIGYLAGLLAKILTDRNPVMYLYILNLLMVATDMTLCLYYAHKIRERAMAAA